MGVCNSARVCGEGMTVMALILRLSAFSPSGVYVNLKKDVWSALNWNLSGLNHILLFCAVSRIEYVLIMLLFTLAILDESTICNSTQAIKLSKYSVHFLLEHISTAGKSEWQPFPPVLPPWATEGAEFVAFVMK